MTADDLLTLQLVSENFHYTYRRSSLLKEVITDWAYFGYRTGVCNEDLEKYILKDMVTRLSERYNALSESIFIPSEN